MTDAPDVLFLGNTAGHTRALIEGLGDRALFGFPAVGGVRDGAAVRYVLIRQQKTTLACRSHSRCTAPTPILCAWLMIRWRCVSRSDLDALLGRATL